MKLGENKAQNIKFSIFSIIQDEQAVVMASAALRLNESNLQTTAPPQDRRVMRNDPAVGRPTFRMKSDKMKTIANLQTLIG